MLDSVDVELDLGGDLEPRGAAHAWHPLLARLGFDRVDRGAVHDCELLLEGGVRMLLQVDEYGRLTIAAALPGEVTAHDEALIAFCWPGTDGDDPAVLPIHLDAEGSHIVLWAERWVEDTSAEHIIELLDRISTRACALASARREGYSSAREPG